MADDLKIKLGLDAGSLLDSLKNASKSLEQLFQQVKSSSLSAQKELANISDEKVDIDNKPAKDSLKEVEKQATESSTKVGDTFKDAFKGAIGGGFLASFIGGNLKDVFQNGLTAVADGFKYALDKGMEFETQLASLSSITGVSGSGLQDLGAKAQAMAGKFGTDASANIESFKTILSKLGPDIAKSPEALNSMAESVNTLSKATGDDPGKATEALTTALLQFGVSLDDPKNAADAMAVAMNVMAAGAKEGASEVPDVAAAINVAGVAAKGAKVSFEETNSAIQILAAGGKVGAEAGTSLRNVLNTLGAGRFLPKDTQEELKKAGVDINKLGDNTVSFSTRLRELEKISGDTALKTKLFGTDAAAATILINGATVKTGEMSSSMDGLTKKLTGTQTATEQAAINMATFGEQMKRVRANIDNFAIGFYQGIQQTFGMLAESTGPAVGEMMSNIGGYFTRLWSVVQPILALIGGAIMVTISDTINVAANVINLFYEISVSAFDGVVNAIRPLVNAITGALGIDGAAGKSIDVVKILQDVMNGLGTVINTVFDVFTAVGKFIVDIFISGLNNLIKIWIALGSAVTTVVKYFGDFLYNIPFIKNAVEGLKSGFDAVYNFFAGLPKIINEVQIYLKAFGYMFSEVFKVLQDSFDRVLKLDFSGAKAALGSLFDSGTWSNLFSQGQQKARAELKQTTEQVQKIGDEFKKFQSETTTTETKPPPTGDKPKGEKTDVVTALEKAKNEYQKYYDELERERNKDYFRFKGTEEEKKAFIEKRLKEDALKQQEYLNQVFTNGTGTEYQTEIKILPNINEGESAGTIIDTYQEIFKKNKDILDKSSNIKVKVDDESRKEVLTELSDFVKEAGVNIKDFEKFSNTFIPEPVNTQIALDKIQLQYQNMVDFLISTNQQLAEKRLLALSLGDNKTVEDIDKYLEQNNKIITETKLRFERFSADSKKAIDNNNIASITGFALVSSFQDVFNAEKIRKENETNKKIREDRLKTLNDEESDLKKAFAKREITAEEYAAKMAVINRERSNDENEQNNVNLKRFKESGDKTIAQVLKTQAAATRETYKNKTDLNEYDKAYGDFLANTLSGFADLAASGTATLKDFGKVSVQIAFDTLTKLIPIFITEIAGKSFAQGPYGIVLAGVLTAALYGLYGQAQASLGFKDGVVNLDGAGTETSDSIPARLSKGESVITARATKNNIDELEWINRTGLSIKEYYSNNLQLSNINVNSDGELIREIRLLRNETAGLGMKIQKNTSVEINGVLKGDGKSISAIIETQNKRNARRG
jgi:TP901 family phage tail tape measure protein